MKGNSAPSSFSTTFTCSSSAREPDAAGIVGRHPAHLAAQHTIESFAPYEHATVLIEGESGTGKSYAARIPFYGTRSRWQASYAACG